MEFIPLQRVDIDTDEIGALVNVLKSGMLIQGEQVGKLEKEFCTYLDVKECVMVANGTASLHLSLIALGVGYGDEVIVPAFSYVATANVVELVGAKPIFIDVEIDSCNIDVSKIEQAITNKTKAIMPVHEFGLCANMDEILVLAKKYQIYVIEDAACALGAKYKQRYAGTFGDLGSFSFHPRKAITSGEGGMIITNDVDLARKLRILRNHGIEMLNGKMEFVEAGFNYRMTDFQAAMLRAQLSKFKQILELKRKVADYYRLHINNSLIHLPIYSQDHQHSWQTYHILLNDKINRDEVIVSLKNAGIGTNYGAQCIPYQKFYKEKYNLNSEFLFPNALTLYRQGLAIPVYASLESQEIQYIVGVINKIS